MANRKGIHPQDVRLHGWPLWRGGLVTVGPDVVLGGLLGASGVTAALGVRSRSRFLRRATVAGALAAAVYALLLRPWHRHWGLTREERLRTYPGDERITRPVSEATHALTIDARPADVWPWLVQLGRSAERILPELQGAREPRQGLDRPLAGQGDGGSPQRRRARTEGRTRPSSHTLPCGACTTARRRPSRP